jgi:hypothetical protein
MKAILIIVITTAGGSVTSEQIEFPSVETCTQAIGRQTGFEEIYPAVQEFCVLVPKEIHND